MSERFFHVGEVVYSIANESIFDTAEMLWKKLSAAECQPATPPVIRFIFRDRIENPGEPVMRIGRAAVGTETLTYQDLSRLRMQIATNHQGGVDVVLAERHYGWLHELAHQINKRWKYHYRYGLAMNEGLAQKVLYSGILPLLYLECVKAGIVLVPASAVVAPDGKALLIAGQRGNGRTALAGYLVESGWRFLGDDVVALRRDGTVLSLALPLQVQSHHAQTSPGLIKRMTQAMDSAELSLWKKAALWGGKARLRWMRADRLWSEEKLAQEAPLGRVIVLQREQKREKNRMETLTAPDAARALVALSLEELRRVAALCLCGNAAGFNLMPDLGEALTQAEKIIAESVANAPMEVLHLAETPDYAELAEKLGKRESD